ncbi:oligosaccharide flippase family protein [Pseudomonas aeruginosa]|nr:oligosaccharide flippase family protein [Pseudomonas aeruginosa]
MGSNYLLPLAAIPFLTRTLSSEAFGQLVIAQAVAVILCQLVDFGFILAGSRKAAIIDNKVELSSFFSVVQSARFLLLLLSLLVLAILAVSSILPIPLLVLVAAALPAVVGNYLQAVWWRPQKLSATPDLSCTVSPCLTTNSVSKNAPTSRSVCCAA